MSRPNIVKIYLSHGINTYKTLINDAYSNNFEAVEKWEKYRGVLSNKMFAAHLLFITISKEVQNNYLSYMVIFPSQINPGWQKKSFPYSDNKK